MFLTEHEKEMLNGKEGEGKQACMKVVYEMGNLYGADRLLPIQHAHMDGVCYTTIWDAGLEFVEYLASVGTKVAVPSTTNITARDITRWKDFRTEEAFSEKSRRIEEAYLKMGCTPTWTCAPYQCSNSPHFGEHVAWSESNAVNYINSVVGARTNRYPDLVELCCAVVGRVPNFGLHLTENRTGTVLFQVEGFPEGSFRDSSEYALLGYLIGRETVGADIPVIRGLPLSAAHDDLKALSAASAAAGSVGLFHAVGITPEARSQEEAFQGKAPGRTVTVTPDVLRQVKRELTTAQREHVDLVLLGCPHASYPELLAIAEHLKGKRVKDGTHLWVQTGKTEQRLLERSDIARQFAEAGVELLTDTCVNNMQMSGWQFDTVVTNSGKMAHYAPGTTGGKIFFASTEECLDAAVRGKVTL